MKARKPLLTILILALLTGCAAPVSVTTQPAQATQPPAETQTGALPTASPQPTLPPGEAVTPVFTPTPDTRPAAADWRDWQIIPDATGTAIQTYQRGQALGRDPQAFSKIGDCQSIKEVMLGIYETYYDYNLPPDSENLEETIRNFRGSFGRDGYAVEGGFNAATVLSPLWADPEACLPGETPIECEFRVHRPAFVIISLEVWWDGRSPERYSEYMRRIIEYSLEQGVVPILSTKADNVEGDHAINLATAELAKEYDLPLWNFWRAVQPLPNRGLDPTRPDGFHISPDAWDVRSYTALQALDSVWRGVSSDGEPPVVAPTAQPTAAPQPALTLAPTPAELGASGDLYFSLTAREGDSYAAQGVFRLDMASGALTQIAPVGWSLQAASPDGQTLLLNEGSSLYRAERDGADPQLLTDMLFPDGRLSVAWQQEADPLILIQQDEDTFVARLSLDGSPPQPLTTASSTPIELYPAPDRLAWENGACSGLNTCERIGAWQADLDGGTQRPLTGIDFPAFSPAGEWFVYRGEKDGKTVLWGAAADGSYENMALLLGAGMSGYRLVDYTWSADGSKVGVLALERSDYSGKQFNTRIFIFTPATWGVQELTAASGQNMRITWSPLGAVLVTLATQEDEEGGTRLSGNMTWLPAQLRLPLDDVLGITSDGYLSVGNLFWLPAQATP
ncbi:MAG: hypothetical protein HPY76_09620 [Anaerolineae bacterium]|nr:hypothetical protein [Anaerolineae bacterium]